MHVLLFDSETNTALLQLTVQNKMATYKFNHNSLRGANIPPSCNIRWGFKTIKFNKENELTYLIHVNMSNNIYIAVNRS